VRFPSIPAPAARKSLGPSDLSKMSESEKERSEPHLKQIVHKHVNGLCIITAGELLKAVCSSGDDAITISRVEFTKEESDGQSVGAKRKKARRAKSNRKKLDNEKGNTQPLDTLAIVTLSDGQKIDLKCCVQGTIIELNHRLDGKKRELVVDESANPSLLLSDPLLDGFLAVILPSGHFPTRSF